LGATFLSSFLTFLLPDPEAAAALRFLGGMMQAEENQGEESLEGL
jgi:hypothetical protein